MNNELSSVTKSITPYEAYQQLYSELDICVYSDHVAIFTDGSTTEEGVGAAAVTPNQTKAASLPKIASVFTAAAGNKHAILDCIN